MTRTRADIGPYAPLPLSRPDAVEQAVRLRRMGWTYTAIAGAMGVYHGWYYSISRWRMLCRGAGCPLSHPTRRVPPR